MYDEIILSLEECDEQLDNDILALGPLEDVVAGLESVTARIIEQAGVTKDDVRQLKTLVPSMEDVAEGYFTSYPSEHGLNVACEGIVSGTASVIGNIFKLIFKAIFKVLEFLLKPIAWLFGGSSSSDSKTGGSGGGGKVEELATKTEELQEKIEKKQKEWEGEVDKGEFKISKLQSVAAGNLDRVITATLESFVSVAHTIESTIGAVDIVFQIPNAKGDAGKVIAASRALKDQTEELDKELKSSVVIVLTGLSKLIGVPVLAVGEDKFAEALSKFRDDVKKAAATEDTQAKPKEVFKAYLSVRSKLLEQAAESDEDIIKVIEKRMKEGVPDLPPYKKTGDESPEYVKAWEEFETRVSEYRASVARVNSAASVMASISATVVHEGLKLVAQIEKSTKELDDKKDEGKKDSE